MILLLVERDNIVYVHYVDNIIDAVHTYDDVCNDIDVTMVEIIIGDSYARYATSKALPQRLCDNCNKPIDNVTGMFIMRDIFNNKHTIGSCCFKNCIAAGWRHIATAK